MSGATLWFLGMMALQGQAAATAPAADPVEYRGDCRYAERLRPLLDLNHTFATCTKVRVSSDASGWHIVFENTRNGRRFAYSGVLADGKMQVRTVRIGDGRDMTARGECSIEGTLAEPETFTCVATRRGRTWAANFQVDRRDLS